MKKLIIALLFLSVFVTCNDNDKNKSVTGVSVSPAVISLSPEETAQLSIIISPGNASNSSCSWVSGNTDAITVSETGLIKAIGYGVSEITVTTNDGGYTDSCTVTVPNYGPEFDTLTTNSSYETGRIWFSSYIYEGFIYVTGGSSTMTSIEYATVTDDGTIGSFSSASLLTGRGYHSCIAYKDYLYIVAGYDDSNTTNTVFYAPIAANGSPGTFQTATGSLNTARGGF